MNDPYRDLLIFDWTINLSSTVLSSRLLQLPQSTISRRMNAFQADHRITVRRSGQGLRVLAPSGYLEDFRKLAQRFRQLHGQLRWAAHPIWLERIPAGHDERGYYLNLQLLGQGQGDKGSLAWRHWLEEQILDAYLDAALCPSGCAFKGRACHQIGLAYGDLPQPSPNGQRTIQLGAFAGVGGLEQALVALGWNAGVSSPKQPLPQLTLIDLQKSQGSEAAPGVLPLGLYIQPQWRHQESFQGLDRHAEVGIKQFEAHLSISINLLSHQTDSSQILVEAEQDGLFSFAPVP
jgi:hypothetical protein